MTGGNGYLSFHPTSFAIADTCFCIELLLNVVPEFGFPLDDIRLYLAFLQEDFQQPNVDKACHYDEAKAKELHAVEHLEFPESNYQCKTRGHHSRGQKSFPETCQ